MEPRDTLGEEVVATLERQQGLAPVEEAVQRAIARLFSLGGPVGQRIRDALNGTWLGHPLHPALTDVPIGAWTVALVLDALEAGAPGWRRRRWASAADTAVTVGVAGAATAALAGLADWQYTVGRARRTGFLHAGLNTTALLLYLTSLVLRRSGARAPGRALGLAGFATVLASAFLGGTLVYRHRIGVDHSDARPRPEAFTPVVEEAALVEGRPHRAEVDGVRIVLVRRGSRVFALAETCAHLGGPLAEGRVEGDTIVCPWHGSRFALEDGRVVNGPSTYPQPCFETRVRDGRVEVRRMAVAAARAA